MARILFDSGKKIGEVSDWLVEAKEPVYKNVLGKTVLSTPANNECTFVSPKPVNRKSELTVIEDGKMKLILKIKSIKGTTVVAGIVSRNSL